MKRASIKKNYLFHSLYQILLVIVPIITTPYVSRVLKSEGIGDFSYTKAFISYIMIFINLGISSYSVRKISGLQEKEKEQKILFWEIIGSKLINSILPITIYVLLIIYYREYSILFLAEGFFVLDRVLDVSWFYSGNENFQKTVTRSLFTKVVSVILIFLCVKQKEDLILYVLILGGTQIAGDIALWLQLPEYIKGGKPSFKNYKEHIGGGIKLLMPELATSIFAYGDRIMLGLLLISKMENGYYEQATKVLALSQGVINSLATVMMPRIANLHSNKKMDEIAYYMNKSLQFIAVIGMPISFGIIGIASNFVPWFLGEDFAKVRFILYVQAPIVIVHGIYYILGYQYLLAVKKEVKMTIIITIGAVSNIVLNYILIPKYMAIGASIASVIAETIIAIILLVTLRKIVSLKLLFYNSLKPLLSSLVMLAVILRVSSYIEQNMMGTFLLIFVGFAVYILMMMLLKEKFLMQQFSVLKSRLKREK